MKLMVRTDMEGASGVVNYCQAEVGAAEYEEGRRYFMSDFKALLEGLIEGGADEIHVFDEHFYGRNIVLDDLPRDILTIHFGKPPYRPDWAGGLDGTFDGMILLGLHSMAGTKDALLPHTYELDIAEIKVDDLVVGEIGMEMLIAGEQGVPTVLVTGDDAGCREARALTEVDTVEVKIGQGASGATVYPMTQTAKWIREAAKKAASGLGYPKVLESGSKNPKLTVKLAEGAYRTAFERLYKGECVDGAITLCEGTLLASWSKYWQMKLAAQAEMVK